MASPKMNSRGDNFLSLDYQAVFENGTFKISLLIDEVPSDLKITYILALCDPWRPTARLDNTTQLNTSFEIKDFGVYSINIKLSSKGKTFIFDTPKYDHTTNNAISYMAANTDFVNWRAKLNNLYSSKCTEMRKDADFVRPLEFFRRAHPGIQVIVHNSPLFPASNRTEHEQKIWDDPDKYGNAIAIRDALYETPPRVINRAWDVLHYENIVNIADCIGGNKAKFDINFHMNDQGVFTVSDSRSPFVNTMLGHRITHGQPEKSERTIWHIGYCRIFGNGAPDWATIDSFLQGLINEKVPAQSIRVENFGYNNMSPHLDQPMRIVNFLEHYMNDDDIVIIDSLDGFPNVGGVLHCDISRLLQRPHNYGECFFDRSHFTENGNRAIAEKLFDFIKENKLLKLDAGANSGINVAGGGTSKHNHLLSSEKRLQLNAYFTKIIPLRPLIGSIVMNCNPFTLGHRYLIEQSAAKCEKLFIFVVEEDKSIFPFADRIELVRQGTADIKNVTVIPSGKFIISSLTFTDYFGKSEMQDRTIDPSLDVELFAQYIAPQMGINIRFAGEEPLDNVTRQYNEAMARILPRHGIKFIVIPRKEMGGGVISASRVRKLLEEKDFKAIKGLVPKTTLKYLRKGAKMNDFSLSCLCKLSFGKNAWQSSEFGIAGDNAANVLNDDGQRDFGFHTKRENKPWWEIDLKDIYKISHIKVTNRRKDCQERAGTLTVEISESGEDGDWQTVHTGIMHWDGDLTFFLAGRVKARWVRLSLKEHNAFHLANVEIWGCAPSIKQITPPAPKRFCLHDAPGLEAMDEISKGASVTKNGNLLTFDFKDIFPIEAVVLEKPLSAGWNGGESLRIETSRDGHSWQLIHEGLMFWVAKMYYPLRGEVIGRYLRLSPGLAPKGRKGFIRSFLASSKGLGLEKARIFTKKADLTVLMARPDGFGARLGAMLTGLYLSKVLNCEFKFVWSQSGHTQDYKLGDATILGMKMDSAEELFSKEFVDDYSADNEKVVDAGKFRGAYKAIRRHILNGKFSDFPGKILAPLLINPNRSYGLLGLNPKLEPNKEFGFRQIFYSLPFHQRIQSAIDMALQVPLPEKIAAVHLRTGDFVYGPVFRKMLGSAMNAVTDRIVSLPLAKMAVKKLLDEGFEVLAFGEDTKMLEILAAEFPELHPAAEFLPHGEWSISQRCIFEMVLMSRARLIVAPKISAFSALPLAIGEGTAYQAIHELLTEDETLDFFLKDLEANRGLYPPLNAAMAYRQLYVLFKNSKEPDFLLHLLSEAAALDPDNEFYPFYQAAEYYRAADYENGEKTIQRFLDMITDKGQKPAAMRGRPFPEDQELIKKAAEIGWPAACRAMSVIYEAGGNREAARHWLTEASYGGIKNLAPAGQARQSSDFDWGTNRITDAAKAFNDDGQRDLGFSTKEEENPRWEVELDDVYAIHRIVLINRRKVCQERILTLTVEVSAEQTVDEWVTVHSGLISWDGKIVLPLAGRVKARRVRLSLREKNLFHLAAVEIWGAHLSMRPESSVKPEIFDLYDQTSENGLEISLKTPPFTGPGLLAAELTAPLPLEGLLINKAEEESWPDLKIETSRDGQNWLIVHEGLLYWAGQMHYPLQGEVFARFVRLSSQAELERGEKAATLDVKILGTKNTGVPCVIHRQNDGLGGRMLSLLNAMYLADALAVPMKMVWPALKRPGSEYGGADVLGQEIGDAEEVFDEEFRASHLMRDLPLTYASKLRGQRNLARRNLISPALMDEPGLLHSSHLLELGTLLSRGLMPVETWELRRYFKQIGFSPEIRAVIEAAENVDLEGAMAAVHLRAGDLVYHSAPPSTFEDILFGFETKGLPVQLARMSIEQALESGMKSILIFSDDLTMSQTLAADYKVGYARQFWPAAELSNTQITLFEAVLMSRASVIYRPDSSSFSRFALTISEGPDIVNAHEFFKYEDILPYFKADLQKNGARYPAPQNAYSYGYLYRISRGRQKADFLLEMLEAAAAAVPENVTFKVFKALELFQAGRDTEGESALQEVFTFKRDTKTFELLDKNSMALRNKDFVNWRNAELRPVFEEAAKRNNPFACHMISFIYSCQGNEAEALAWRDAALRDIA